jgi:hypothetical protein
MYGLKHTEESKHKISESGKGRIFTKERNDKISKKLKGRKFDEKWKENISKSAKGRKASETTKKKLSNIHKGKVVSNETRNKLRVNATGNQNMLGKRHTKNTRKLMSEKQKGGGYRTGIPHTNETKEQMMLSRAKFFANKRGVSLEYYMEHHYKKRSKK